MSFSHFYPGVSADAKHLSCPQESLDLEFLLPWAPFTSCLSFGCSSSVEKSQHCLFWHTQLFLKYGDPHNYTATAWIIENPPLVFHFSLFPVSPLRGLSWRPDLAWSAKVITEVVIWFCGYEADYNTCFPHLSSWINSWFCHEDSGRQQVVEQESCPCYPYGRPGLRSQLLAWPRVVGLWG